MQKTVYWLQTLNLVYKNNLFISGFLLKIRIIFKSYIWVGKSIDIADIELLSLMQGLGILTRIKNGIVKFEILIIWHHCVRKLSHAR